MKRLLAILSVLGLLILPVGGCGDVEDIVSSAPESATDISAAVNVEASATTTTWGKTNAICTYPTAPFTVGATVREQDEAFAEDFHGEVITSKAQLDALALDAEYKADGYTERYFEDKALVVLEFTLSSGSTQLQVGTLRVNGDTMTVFYTTVRPSPFTNDMAYRRILLQVDRKKVERVKTVVGEEHSMYSNYSNPTVF